MKSLGFRCYALCSSIAVAMLTGCGGSQPPICAPGIDRQSRGAQAVTRTETTGATNSHVRVLYRFHRDDGHYPEAALLDVGGTLYGTAPWGGSHGWGAVFAISADGTEHVLHSFPDEFKGDGSVPVASLIAVNGTLYGTTSRGGANRCEAASLSAEQSLTSTPRGMSTYFTALDRALMVMTPRQTFSTLMALFTVPPTPAVRTGEERCLLSALVATRRCCTALMAQRVMDVHRRAD